MWLKVKSILIAFSDNCGYSSLMLYQTLTSGCFSEVSCNAEYEEALSVNFLLSVRL